MPRAKIPTVGSPMADALAGKPRRVRKAAPAEQPYRLKILLDSGAFTAWNTGKPVDLKEYCEFIKRNEDWIDAYAALDVINPGHPEEAAAAGMENYKYMRAQGLRPMPIYHANESIEWLDRMCDMGADYVGLSASSLVKRNRVDDWYGLAWSHLCDPQGRPLIKAHAFGEGRGPSLKKFPFYSADSASWLWKAQLAGTVVLGKNGRVSQRNDGVSSKRQQDMSRLPPEEREALVRALADAGLKPDALEPDPRRTGRQGGDWVGFGIRTYLAAMHYRQMAQEVSATYPIHLASPGLMSRPVPSLQAHEPLEIPELRYNLVVGPNPVAMGAVVAARHEYILVSFAHIMGSTTAESKLRRFAHDPVGAILDPAGWSTKHRHPHIFYEIIKERQL